MTARVASQADRSDVRYKQPFPVSVAQDRAIRNSVPLLKEPGVPQERGFSSAVWKCQFSVGGCLKTSEVLQTSEDGIAAGFEVIEFYSGNKKSLVLVIC